MQTTELVARLTAALEPEASARGYELVAIEQAGGRGTPVLRVLLDREEGVNLDAIAEASHWVSEILDAEEPFGRPYTLEVSSPGIDRPLTKREDFTRFVGEMINLKVVGDGLSLDAIVAAYHDGVLTLTIPVAEQSKPRRITVEQGKETDPNPTVEHKTVKGTGKNGKLAVATA